MKMQYKVAINMFLILAILSQSGYSLAQQTAPSTFSFDSTTGWAIVILFLVLALFILVLTVRFRVEQLKSEDLNKNESEDIKFKKLMNSLDAKQITTYLTYKKEKVGKRIFTIAFIVFYSLVSNLAFAQGAKDIAPVSLLTEKGILITIVLILIPIILGLILVVVKVIRAVQKYRNEQDLKEAAKFSDYIKKISDDVMDIELGKRKNALEYQLSNNELSGVDTAEDSKGVIAISNESGLPIVAQKKSGLHRPKIDADLSKLIIWFLGSATFWLIFGTTIGEYIGIKFVAPDADHISWLSFGRLRPVHTNAVFWGWASLAMLGLGYYVVPRVSNTALASLRKGWYTLYLVNAAVVLGTLCLMAGINNGGGEYREYVWPVMLLFAIGLILTLINFIQTIARRTTKEIYIANWYIVASIIFAIVISIVAYVPIWQNGLGETIIQGYYMHQGVGMWFMLFTLGIVYYFLPQQLNKPIYSYSLGILAFWTQILFYTLIGTHHFVFSAIPWWLQTIAIVGSAGMIIPVVAGTTNFILTFKGAWYKIKDSYTLPFFLVGIVFYFTGSMQGTAEAFRSTNLIWHFTDFTVAHSHLTMYGIICFFLWAAIYAVVPRLTGKEAPQITIGAHFWFALIGMMFYTIPLMYGSTLKGLLWMQGKPFIDGVVLMAPYWLWRAIGGSLMWVSHIFFAYNMFKMISSSKLIDVKEEAMRLLQDKKTTI